MTGQFGISYSTHALASQNVQLQYEKPHCPCPLSPHPTPFPTSTTSPRRCVTVILSWEAHISEVVSKVAKVLAALRRLRPICPQSTLVAIYKSLILPHLDYCSAVWGCIGNGLSQKLEKLQNRAARIITGSGWDVRSAQILCALKWESLADRRSKQLKSLMFKTANNLVPEYLSDKFTSVNTIHRHNLRGAQHNLFIPRPNTEALKKSFRYRGALTWNDLSVEAKQATTLNNFYSAIEC